MPTGFKKGFLLWLTVVYLMKRASFHQRQKSWPPPSSPKSYVLAPYKTEANYKLKLFKLIMNIKCMQDIIIILNNEAVNSKSNSGQQFLHIFLSSSSFILVTYCYALHCLFISNSLRKWRRNPLQPIGVLTPCVSMLADAVNPLPFPLILGKK